MKGRKFALYLMAMLYVAAGINHFLHPATYLKIIPHFLPWHETINAVSGAAEIILGALLFPSQSRSGAAWSLVALLIAVFPANIQMAVDWTAQAHPQTWLAYARLPLQPLLIWWAVSYTRWYKTQKRNRESL